MENVRFNIEYDSLSTSWSTSLQVLRCHLCNSHHTELIPISTNESFRINYNVTRSMELEFHRNNKIIDRQESTDTTSIVLNYTQRVYNLVIILAYSSCRNHGGFFYSTCGYWHDLLVTA